MNRTFLVIAALGLWANAAATIVHAAWTSTKELTSINEKMGKMEASLATLTTVMQSPTKQ